MKKRPEGPFFHLFTQGALQALGEGAGDHVTLLLRGQGVETHGVTGDADGELRVFFRVGDGVFQGFAAQYVDVQVQPCGKNMTDNPAECAIIKL